MTLLAVERIKLFTTRSPWWCTLAALAVTMGFAALMTGTAKGDGIQVTVASTQFGYSFGLVVIMVMAALAVTTEYRFSTIRATFQAVPNRTSTLLAKTTVVALLAGVIGELAAFGSWGLSTLMTSEDIALNTPFEWRAVAGVGLVYAIAAVIAVSVGIMIRHSAGAISLLLIYTQLVETLITLIPTVGPKIHKWLPFNLANHFVTGAPDATGRPDQFGPMPSDVTTGPWQALALFAGFAVVTMIVSLVVANRRDA